MFNFWGYILKGVIDIFTWIIQPFPLAQPNVLLASIPSFISQAIIPAYFWVSPIIDLRIVGVMLGVLMVLEIVRGLIAAWRWILTLIPAAG